MKVKKIRRIAMSKPVPVYDITVPEHANFCISPGLVAHNSKDLADSFAGVVAGLTLKNEIWARHGVAVSRHLRDIVSAGEASARARDERLAASA